MERAGSRARIASMAGTIGLTASLVVGVTAPLAQARTEAASVLVNGAGSTFIQPLMQEWSTTYTKANPDVKINYQGTGSGAGQSALFAGTVQFAASDAYLSDAQLKEQNNNALHIPLTIGPVAMMYNLSGVNNIKLTGDTLAKMYMGTITKWNDPAIAKENSGVKLPDTAVSVVYRSDGSGTTFIFTHFLSAFNSDWKSKLGASTTVNWPTGQGAKGTPGVVEVIKRTAGAIGYGELSYAKTSGLPAASIKNKAGNFVAPSPEAASACAASAPSIPADMRGLLVTCTAKDAYPITGFTWGITLKNYTSGDEAVLKEMTNYLWWCINEGQVGYPTKGNLEYAPLPSKIIHASQGQINAITYNGKALHT
jgi:phosphate transport system substrate-binding protein